MELADYLRLLIRSWVTIVVCSLLGVALATAYLLAQPVLYSATSSSYVSLSSVRDVSDAAAGTSFAQSTATNLAELAESPYVLNNVRRTLRISTPVSTLQQQVQAQAPAQSAVVQVTATTTQPSLSSALANAVTTELGYAVERLNPNAGNATSIARATTISTAATPTAPVSPTVLFDLAVGLLGGFGVGVLLVLIRQAVDQRVRSADQLVRVSRAPVIGTVPDVPAASEGASVVLEAGRVGLFRTVRSEILEGASQSRVVVISGTKPGESTASFAASIGASVANARLTTLVLDAASTSAPAAPIFDGRTEPGLSEVLDRSRTLDQSIVRGPVEGLWYLPPGRPSAERDDLVASFEMTDLLEAAITKFNVIIVSTDAVEDSPIARSLGRQSDGVILASELNVASVGEVRRASDSLERAGARLIGTIAVDPERRAPKRRAARPGVRRTSSTDA